MATTIGVTTNDEIPTKKELSEKDKEQIKFYLQETKSLITKLKGCTIQEKPFESLEPLAADHWEFEVGGLNPQVVSKVEFPNYTRNHKLDIAALAASRRKLTVTFMEAINPSTFQAIEQMILTSEIHKPMATLKLLNHVGEVTKSYVFLGMEIDAVDFDPLDHNSRNTLKAKVSFSYQILKEIDESIS